MLLKKVLVKRRKEGKNYTVLRDTHNQQYLACAVPENFYPGCWSLKAACDSVSFCLKTTEWRSAYKHQNLQGAPWAPSLFCSWDAGVTAFGIRQPPKWLRRPVCRGGQSPRAIHLKSLPLPPVSLNFFLSYFSCFYDFAILWLYDWIFSKPKVHCPKFVNVLVNWHRITSVIYIKIATEILSSIFSTLVYMNEHCRKYFTCISSSPKGVIVLELLLTIFTSEWRNHEHSTVSFLIR